MRVLVVGTGYLGRAVVAHLEDIGACVRHTFHAQKYFEHSVKFDLFSHDLNEAVPLGEIDVVVFTSMVEDSPDTDAVLRAMQNAFLACKDKRVIYISTDAVFDGRKGMYQEDDIANPATSYGKHKKMCEDILQESVLNYCIIRPSYIYGFSLGSLDNRLERARALIRDGQRINRFVDMFKSPIEVNALAKIIGRVSRSDFRGVVHAGGDRMSVFDFYKQALGTLGERIDLLEPDTIPKNAPPEYLVDTSLDTSLLKEEFGFDLGSPSLSGSPDGI